MLQRIDKKSKYFLYFVLFLFLNTINNFSWDKKKENLSSIRNIEVKGLEEVQNLKIKKKLFFLVDKNIFFLNKKQIEEELNKYNFLENYKVYKIFPSNIKISLNQTELLASTLKDNKKYFVGANGNLINHDDIIKKYDLPHIFGSFPVEKFILLKKNIYDANFKYNNIENFYYYPNGRWDIKSKNNITIKLPSKNIKDSILKAKILIENNQITENKIIDLRIPNQVILING